MILLMFAVFDRAAGAFNRPFFAVSENMAKRAFTDEVNREDVQNSCFHHPEDFDLHYMGTFDDNTGKLDPHDPRPVCRAQDLKKKK